MRRALLPAAALSNMLTVNRHIVAINSAFDVTDISNDKALHLIEEPLFPYHPRNHNLVSICL